MASATTAVATLTHTPPAAATRLTPATDLHLVSAVTAAYWPARQVIHRPGASITACGTACALAGTSLLTHLATALTSTPNPVLSASGDALFALVLLWLTTELTHPAATGPATSPPGTPDR